MASLTVVFWMYIALFAVIGAMRGWAKEVLVIFSVILALALIAILENLVPVVSGFIKSNATIQFWIRELIVLSLVFFGYQSPKLAQLSKGATRRDQIQDVLLGLILGMVSGFLIVGTLWSYMDTAGYPFSPLISAPTHETPLGDAAQRLVRILPPLWLGKTPNIYIFVVLAFIFVIVVFL